MTAEKREKTKIQVTKEKDSECFSTFTAVSAVSIFLASTLSSTEMNNNR